MLQSEFSAIAHDRVLERRIFLGAQLDLLAADRPRFVDRIHSFTGSRVLHLHLTLCAACEGTSIWVGPHIVFPSWDAEVSAPNPDLPAEIRADYDEAARVLAISPRSAAALLRLAIQKLCEHLLGRRSDINEMIGELVQRGLDPVVQQALDVVRVVGNGSVHAGQLDVKDDPETAARLFLIVNHIAEAMITRPGQIKELYGMIPEEKREAIVRRDAPKRPRSE